ncbi:MAG: tRNA (adenosine(37)-N6)-threonylcarbamoyltransferase complex dimerization subunit type 1 TsaB [Alphaproteobacteria bacterium]
MILIIDTSSSEIKLLLDNKYKFVEVEKQSLSLPTETEKFLTENNAKFSDLTAIGVVVGPGSFTGIRLGIAYAKGLAMGLGIRVIPVNAFEIYLESDPDAFVAIDSHKGDFFVGAKDLEPQIMDIEQVETKQFDYQKTTGHKPYDLTNALPIVQRKLKSDSVPVIPLYIRPSYAEQNRKSS